MAVLKNLHLVSILLSHTLLVVKELIARECFSPKKIDPCPEGWTATQHPRTCVRNLHHRLEQWHASQHCLNQDNGHLVIARDVKMADLITAHVKNLEHSSLFPFWLGARAKGRKSNEKWYWMEDSTEIDFTGKSYRQPPPIRVKKFFGQNRGALCGSVLSAADDYSWAGSDCSYERMNYYCEKHKWHKECPAGWIHLEPLKECIKAFFTKITYEAAKSECKSHGATLLTFRTNQKFNLFKEYADSRDAFWIGLFRKEGKFIWTYGDETKYTKWKRSPNPNPTFNCVYMRSDGLWRNEDCGRKLHFICQIESQLGPTTPEMPIVYHRQFDVFYLNQVMEVTCKAVGTEQGQIYWSTVDKASNTPKNLAPRISNKIVNVFTNKGHCLPQTVSTWRVNVTRALQGVVLSCYSFNISYQAICNTQQSWLEYCQKSAVLSVTDGPLPPRLKVNFYTHPATMRLGQVLNAQCKVWPGADEGTLEWVIYPYRRKPLLLVEGDKEVVVYEESVDARTGRHVLTSELKLPVNKSMFRMVIACFAYDASTWSTKLACKQGEIYCVKTPRIRVTDDKLPDWEVDFIHFVKPLLISNAMVVVLLIGICICGMRKRPRHSILSEDDPAAPGGQGSHHDLATEKRQSGRKSDRKSMRKSDRKSMRKSDRKSMRKSDGKGAKDTDKGLAAKTERHSAGHALEHTGEQTPEQSDEKLERKSDSAPRKSIAPRKSEDPSLQKSVGSK